MVLQYLQMCFTNLSAFTTLRCEHCCSSRLAVWCWVSASSLTFRTKPPSWQVIAVTSSPDRWMREIIPVDGRDFPSVLSGEIINHSCLYHVCLSWLIKISLFWILKWLRFLFLLIFFGGVVCIMFQLLHSPFILKNCHCWSLGPSSSEIQQTLMGL